MGGSEVQSHQQLFKELWASVGYMVTLSKDRRKEKGRRKDKDVEVGILVWIFASWGLSGDPVHSVNEPQCSGD